MAKTTNRGSGQGRVTRGQRGILVKCSDAERIRHCEFLFPPGQKPAERPTYHCGLKPLVPKVKERVGQQKQARKK